MIEQRISEFFGASVSKKALEANRGWVFACVNAIATEVSDIKLRLNRRNAEGEPEEVTEHAVLELLRKVNPRMTMHQLIEVTQSHKELEGNAFWFLAKDRAGQTQEIWPLRPDRTILVPSKENPLLVEKYIYRHRTSKVEFKVDEIIHFPQFNAETEYPFPSRGMGTVQAAELAIDTNDFARNWNKGFFQRSARPDLILKTDAKLSPEQYERLKRQFEQAHQGAEKSHKPMILQGGLDIKELTRTQKDMDFVRQVIQTRDEILAVFRVPKSVLGIVEDVNRSNAEASIFIFASGTIKPKMQEFVDVLNEFLLPMFGEENLWFTFESPVPENRERIVDEYSKGIDKWLTRNDIRAAEGLPPTESGDNIFAPFTVAPIDRVIPEEKKKESPKKKRGHKPKPKPKAKGDKDIVKRVTDEHISRLFIKKNGKKKKGKPEPEPLPALEKKNLNFNQVQQFGRIWVKGIEEREVILKESIQEFFDDQEKRVLDNLKEVLKGLKKKEYKLKQVGDLLIPQAPEVDIVIDLLTPQYLEYLRETSTQAAETFGLTFEFDESDPAVQEFIETRARFFAESINETTFNELVDQIEAGIADGESLTKISERIAETYQKTRDFRTERIARTEVSAASNFGNLHAFKEAGVTLKEWVNFDPEDSPCLIGGEVVGIDEAFSNGLEAPPAHPNCVCAVIAVFE